LILKWIVRIPAVNGVCFLQQLGPDMFDDVIYGGFNNLSITGGNMQLNNEKF